MTDQNGAPLLRGARDRANLDERIADLKTGWHPVMAPEITFCTMRETDMTDLNGTALRLGQNAS
ncbi:hypothetical protein [Tateyamaria pelophila]|uniref:hypothetical protein n=1 Tax=Tateyamaria pelophila TaxID=328415 RepID=UPI001CC0D4DB|nr:hypothetical protein [Tateyamaria pelophila]